MSGVSGCPCSPVAALVSAFSLVALCLLELLVLPLVDGLVPSPPLCTVSMKTIFILGQYLIM
eukprot:9862977-Heterocapsa_arctica.AAC.1